MKRTIDNYPLRTVTARRAYELPGVRGLTRETLECGHERLSSNTERPSKRRRCTRCREGEPSCSM